MLNKTATYYSTHIIKLLCLLVFSASLLAEEAIQIGNKIYNEGRLPSGEFIPATIHGDIKVTGEQVICASCHRKSGMGTLEGQQVVPAIAGNMLFEPLRLPTSKPPLPPALRPAYDLETLKRALIEGIDANGDILDPFMPRYEISDEDLDSLVLYLNSLSTKPDPGVDDTDIHFATIVIGDANSPRNKAMLDVFKAFIEQKNTETRNESSRAANAPWHKEWMMKTYRKWNYHVWNLKGESTDWKAQLQAYYDKQPVFAVINGVVDESFAPIHQFCEENGVPCLFPTTQLPTLDEDDFYTLYLNRGYIFEGETLAAYLNQKAPGKSVIHITDINDKHAYHAAYGLRANLDRRKYKMIDLGCEMTGTPDVSLRELQGHQALVIHLDRQCSNQLLDMLAKGGNTQQIYLSSRLYGTDLDEVPAQIKSKIRFVHTQELPSKRNRLLARSTGWFKHKRILNPDEMEVQANAYFALKVAGDALKHIRGYFFRDYFIEKIEHTIDDVPYTSIYPRLSLAPGQRFSSRGYYITKIDEKRNRLSAITEWQAP